MSLAAKRAEREMELRATLQLREREIEKLKLRKEELHGMLNMSTGTGKRAMDLGLSYPVTAYCGTHPSKKVASVPLEHVENILTQLRVARSGIQRQNGLLRHAIHDAELELRQQGEQQKRMQTELETVSNTTGISIQSTKRTKGTLRSTNNRSASGGESAAAPASESNAVVAASAKLSNAEITKRSALLSKEIRAAQVVLHKKAKTLADMREHLEQQEEMHEVANQLANEIRCVDRDMREKRETLKEHCDEHDVVEDALQTKLSPSSPESQSLVSLERDVDHINNLATNTVVNERRMQERVIKAQEYRIAELQKRLASVEKALASHKLTAEVDRMRIESMRGDSTALQVTDNEEDLYDIELIIPAQEKVHPAIYSLLLAEKERLAKRVGVLNLISKEREETIDALTCKVEALGGECTRAVVDFDKKVADASTKEKDLRMEAMEWVQENRDHYDVLLRRRNELRAKAAKAKRR